MERTTTTPVLTLFVLFALLTSYLSLAEEHQDTATAVTPQIETTEDLPTFEALVDLMKPDQDDPELSKDAKRVEKLTKFLSKFKLDVEKVTYQAQRFKDTIQNKGQNYQDMKRLLKDIYHKMWQDAFDKIGYNP